MIDTDLTGTVVHGMSVRRFVIMMTDASGDVTETATATETQNAFSGNDSTVVETATATETQDATSGAVDGSSRNSVLVGEDASVVSPRRFVSLLATDSFSEVVESTSAVSTQDAVGGAQPSAGANVALTASIDAVSARRFVTLLDTTSAPAEVAGKNTLLLGGDANAVSARRFVLHLDEGTNKQAAGYEAASAVDTSSAVLVSAGFNATLVGSANEDEVFLRRFVFL